MDLVVVYLTEAKKYVIVLEKHVYDLNMKKVKNYGVNTVQDHLVYWSSACVEGEYYPEANIDAGISSEFLPDGESWYKGRTLYYCSEYSDSISNI